MFSKLAVKEERSGFKVQFKDNPISKVSKITSPVAAISEWSERSSNKPAYDKKKLILPSLEDLDHIKSAPAAKTVEQQDILLKRKYIRELIDFQVQLMLKEKESADLEMKNKMKTVTKKSYNVSVQGRQL